MIARAVNWFGKWLTRRHAESYGRLDGKNIAVLMLSPQMDVFSSENNWSRHFAIKTDQDSVKTFLDSARSRDWKIILAPLAWTEDAPTTALSETGYFRLLRQNNLLKAGTAGAQLTTEMVSETDIILPERAGLNAFYGTELQAILIKHDIQRLVILGGVANADLDSTARMAVELDYDVTVAGDMVSAFSKQDIDNIMKITLPRIVSRILTSDSILREST